MLPLTNCAFNKSGTCFITGSYDRTCKVWDTQTGEELHTLEGHKNVVYVVRTPLSPPLSHTHTHTHTHTRRRKCGVSECVIPCGKKSKADSPFLIVCVCVCIWTDWAA